MSSQTSQERALPIVVGASMFLGLLDVTVVNVALPSLGRDFSVPPTAVAGVSIAYLVSMAVFLPIAGWLADRFGGKRVLLGAIGVFALSSALCGTADGLGELVLFRALQGVGGGVVMPVGLAMLNRTFPPTERARVMATLAIPVMLAPIFGPVVGGLVVTALSWRWVFFLNLPVSLGAVAYGAICLADDGMRNRRPFDRPGFVLAGLGFGAFMYGVSEGPLRGWGGAPVLVATVTGVVALGVFVVVELRVEHPLLDLRVLRNRPFRSGSLVTLLTVLCFIGSLFGVTLYLQDGLGLSPFRSGLSIFPEAVGAMTGSQLAGRFLYRRLGPRRLAVGGLLALAVVSGLIAVASQGHDVNVLRVLLFFLGFTMTQVALPTETLAFLTVSSDANARSTSVFEAARQFGGPLGVALFGSVISVAGRADGRQAATLVPYGVAFTVSAGVLLGTAVIALLMIRDDGVTGGLRDAGAVKGSRERMGVTPQDRRQGRRVHLTGAAAQSQADRAARPGAGGDGSGQA